MEMEKKINMSELKFKKMMLTMKKLLTAFNNTIVDGLIQWKSNIDKEFEGVDVVLYYDRSVLFASISYIRRLDLFLQRLVRPAARLFTPPVYRNGLRLQVKMNVLFAKVNFCKQFLYSPGLNNHIGSLNLFGYSLHSQGLKGRHEFMNKLVFSMQHRQHGLNLLITLSILETRCRTTTFSSSSL